MVQHYFQSPPCENAIYRSHINTQIVYCIYAVHCHCVDSSEQKYTKHVIEVFVYNALFVSLNVQMSRKLIVPQYENYKIIDIHCTNIKLSWLA